MILDKPPVVCYTLELSEKGSITLTLKEQHLIEQVRELRFGWLKIVVQDGQPVRVEEGIKSVML